MRRGVLIPNSAGLVTTTLVAIGNLVHTYSPNGRHAKIRTIMWSNNTGFNGTLIFGTLNNAGAPAFVPLLPTITIINGFDGELTKDEIPEVIWRLDRSAAPAGRTGDIYVLGSIAGILVNCTIEEL